MGTNKIVVAILFAALLICLTIYLVGGKQIKIPAISESSPETAQTTVVVSPTTEPITPTSQGTSTLMPDDLSLVIASLAGQLNVQPSDLVVTITKKIGIYARGSVQGKGETTGGGQWWGALVNGKWILVYAGQNYPKCSVLTGYSFPKELLDSCIDDKTNAVISL